MNTMWVLSIGLGGALGSISRFGVSALLNQAYPWGTLLVNVLGSLILGSFFAASKSELIPGDSLLFAFVAIGFCGAFTTFSTFSLEVFRLWNDGQAMSVLIHIFANFTLTLCAVIGGYYLLNQAIR